MYNEAIGCRSNILILFYLITAEMMDGNIGLFISALVGLGVTAAK